MKLSYQQLPLHLKKNLLPIYLITGNEYLLLQEARDLIYSYAKQQGFLEITRLDANKNFDWQKLLESSKTLSLFSDKKFIEIKLNHKPAATEAKLFSQYIEALSRDEIVVILSEKLESNAQKSSWYSSIEKLGAIVTIWPMDINQFKLWAEHRLKKHNLICDPAAIELLIHQTEGNLLAFAQEIEKLKLLFTHKPITLNDMTNAIADNAKYDIFNFLDTILEGNIFQIKRVLQKLREEAAEPTLLLWAMTREIRYLLKIILDVKNNTSWDAIIKKHKIWDKRKNILRASIKRHSPESLHDLLLCSGEIDRVIKGLQPGHIWDELEIVALKLGGIDIGIR